MDQGRSEKILKDKAKIYISSVLRPRHLKRNLIILPTKTYLKKLRKKGKIAYYANLLHKYKTDSKQILQVMKRMTGRQKAK